MNINYIFQVFFCERLEKAKARGSLKPREHFLRMGKTCACSAKRKELAEKKLQERPTGIEGYQAKQNLYAVEPSSSLSGHCEPG